MRREPIEVTAPLIMDRGNDRVVIEFMPELAVAMNRHDAEELKRKLTDVLIPRRSRLA